MSQTNEQAGLEDIWYLKQIEWSPRPEFPKKSLKVITQNYNGPCSFIAICNILILRDQIHIQPADRVSVSYEYLSNLVAEYMLSQTVDVDPSAALSILPATRKGMDLNPVFISTTSFRPAGDAGELKLFQFVGIKLVHGWLVDPEDPEYTVLSKVEDYDTAVNTIAFADHLTKGQLVRATEDFEALADMGSNWSPEERQKVEDAIILHEFLGRTSTQLTYHGLFHLANDGMEPGELVALFRGSHLSVLYKSTDPERPGLYTLVTDQVFAQEPSVVWEAMEDVEGGASTFVDSAFVRASPAGGDFAGRSAEAVRWDYEDESMDADHLLARQLQHEEDSRAREWEARQRQFAQEEESRRVAQERQPDVGDITESLARLPVEPQRPDSKEKRKKDCLIM